MFAVLAAARDGNRLGMSIDTVFDQLRDGLKRIALRQGNDTDSIPIIADPQLCTGLQDYERPDRGMFVVPADCWGIPRPAARSTCSQTAWQSEHFGFSASFPGTLCSEEPRIGLPGLPSSLSGQLVFVWADSRR